MSTAEIVHADRLGQSREVRTTVSFFRRGIRDLVRKRVMWIAAAILLTQIVAAVIPLGILPRDPTQISIPERFAPPGWVSGDWSHPFGTDNLGRDLAGRLIYAARFTLIITISATVLASVTGAIAGLLAGYFGGWTDTIIARLIDVLLSFPTIFLALTVIAVAGSSLFNVILVLAIVDWAAFARVVRSSVIATRDLDYVDAARAVGASDLRIVSSHVLPNVMAPIVVLMTYTAARILLVESSLSFLGLGVVPPEATWGTMVGDGRNYLHNAWWVSTIPGFVIALTVLAISFMGDAMRDAFDPQSK